MEKRNSFVRTPLLIYTEYKPFQSIFDFLLCPFECSYPTNTYSKWSLNSMSLFWRRVCTPRTLIWRRNYAPLSQTCTAGVCARSCKSRRVTAISQAR